MRVRRTKKPKGLDELVISKAKGNCFCGKRGDQIHHIDGDPSHNEFDNLAYLCFNDHNEAEIYLGLSESKKKGLRKGLSPALIKKRRNELYALNERKDEAELDHYKKTFKNINEVNLFRASLDAAIILDIIKIKYEFFDTYNWQKRNSILIKLLTFNRHSSITIANEVFNFCEDVSHLTRHKMPLEVSDTIDNLVDIFFPSSFRKSEISSAEEMASKCSNLAFNITYDAFIHLRNLAIACAGLRILNGLYLRGKSMSNKKMQEKVLKRYTELEAQLNRPSDDFKNEKQLLNLYKKDIENYPSIYPENMTRELEILIDEHGEKSSFSK